MSHLRLGGIFHDFLNGPWEDVRGYLIEELQQLRVSLTAVIQDIEDRLNTTKTITLWFQAVNPGAGATTDMQLQFPTGTTAFSIDSILSQISVHNAGSVVGGALMSSSAVTAGSVSLRLGINGNTSGPNIVTLNSDIPRARTNNFPTDAIPFAAESLVGAKLVTSPDYSPTTNDFVGFLVIEFGS